MLKPFYVIRKFLEKFYSEEDDLSSIPLPVPEITKIIKCANTDFEDISGQINKLTTTQKQCTSKLDKISPKPDETSLNRFKSDMLVYMKNASENLDQLKDLKTSTEKSFKLILKSYCVSPKKRGTEVSCNEFFSYWTEFTAEFKVSWEKEIKQTIKRREKILKEKVAEIRKSESANILHDKSKTRPGIKPVKEGGLKAKMAKRLGKKSHI